MAGLHVLMDWQEPFVVITVLGDVDATTIAELQQRVGAAAELSPHLLFDLAGMTFMDSAGIRVLLDAYAVAKKNGGSVRVSGPRPSPRKVMELVGLAAYIPIHASLSDALLDEPA